MAAAAIGLMACSDATTTPLDPVGLSTRETVSSSSPAAGRKLIADQYIVVIRSGAVLQENSKTLLSPANGRTKMSFNAGLRGFAARLNASEIRALRSDPAVEYVEQDQWITVGVGKPTTGGGGGSKGGKGGKNVTVTPVVDSGTFVQNAPPSWGLDRVDQYLIPLSNSYAYTATGAGVNVYIIDSGIRTTHKEFGGRAVLDTSFIDDGYGATGCNWHGTHVAATVGGVTTGVAKGVTLHSVRILDCNAAGSVSGAIAGIDWVIANSSGPAIINLSVAAPSSQALNDAVDRAVAAGITVVAAAGNNASDACAYSPASATNAITVGATNSGDQQAEFSNFGPCVDIMAPGDAIMSASSADDTSLQYGSGTSMAAPHIAGAAALILEQDPTATPATVTSKIFGMSSSGLVGAIAAGTPNLLLRTR